MNRGCRKSIFVIIIMVLITLSVLWILKYKENMEQMPVYMEFTANPQEGCYEITTVEEYLKFAETVALGNTYEWCEVHLNADLDFIDVECVPVIGNSGEELIAFNGIFNGNGHTIHNMSIRNPEDVSGMFANLGGIVMNLRLENCSFEGGDCGAITAKSMVNAVVVNCDVDAETGGGTHGAIAGKFNGFIFNCISTDKQFVGELRGGWTEQCYYEELGKYISIEDEGIILDGARAAHNLNKYLPRVADFHEVIDLNRWEFAGEVSLAAEKAELLETMRATFLTNNEEITLNAYYSQNDDYWCVAVPAGYAAEKMTMIATTNKNNQVIFPRTENENIMRYTLGEYVYDIHFLTADNLDTVYITLAGEKKLDDIHKNKINKIPGFITLMNQSGQFQKITLKEFYGHGNDSWAAPKKSYNLKLENRENIFGMGENEDYVLLAGYRDNSLMSYVTTTSLIRELGFEYSPEFRLVNLYVEGEYAGVYFLAEKIELDENRIEIENIYDKTKKLNHNYLDSRVFKNWKSENTDAERYFYEVEKQPEDLSGGYLLEFDVEDYSEDESRFVTDRGVKITMKRARYSSEEQVNYIADYWQEFEDALYSPNGKNNFGKHYSEYIDMECFVMQWLLYELVQEGSMSSSIYFYKESDVTGDGLLHACFPWDMEHSYLLYGPIDQMWLKDSETLSNYWSRFWIHKDFREAANKVWKSKFVPAIQQMVLGEVKITDEMKNLSWYEEEITGLSVLERSRWRKMNPYNRCEEIREFLNVRNECLSMLLAE